MVRTGVDEWVCREVREDIGTFASGPYRKCHPRKHRGMPPTELCMWHSIVGPQQRGRDGVDRSYACASRVSHIVSNRARSILERSAISDCCRTYSARPAGVSIQIGSYP